MRSPLRDQTHSLILGLGEESHLPPEKKSHQIHVFRKHIWLSEMFKAMWCSNKCLKCLYIKKSFLFDAPVLYLMVCMAIQWIPLLLLSNRGQVSAAPGDLIFLIFLSCCLCSLGELGNSHNISSLRRNLIYNIRQRRMQASSYVLGVSLLKRSLLYMASWWPQWAFANFAYSSSHQAVISYDLTFLRAGWPSVTLVRSHFTRIGQ